MRVLDGQPILSPSDLSNFLSCRHRTGLELAAAKNLLDRPKYEDPYTALLKKHGEEHERTYVEFFRAQGKNVLDLKNDAGAAVKTLEAMRTGVDVIFQGRLEGHLVGLADILRRVEEPSDLGAWSYEVHDTKLTHETKGGTILQLSGYSDLVAKVQGRMPEWFHVITPVASEPYRVEDYAAYYRMVLATLHSELSKGHDALIAANYPEPVEACSVCAWAARCEKRRRDDDHLSLIANCGRSNRAELTAQGMEKLAAVAAMPVPVTFKPAQGARETYDRIGGQARVQLQQRIKKRPVFERLPIAEGKGLRRLPAPSTGDVFLDLEGAQFARDGGREYLFGVFTGGTYRAFWALNDAEERAAFEAVMDLIAEARATDPGMHVYHFNHYEPTAFKKLMGRYVTRAEKMDRLLREERFVDLYPIARQAVRAGVESYSIKQLEQYSGYTRAVPLANVGAPLLAVEIALDAQIPDAITGDIRRDVQGYNEDDCRSTEALRDWFERLRRQWEAEGTSVQRPAHKATEGEKPVSTVQQHAVAVRERLLASISAEAVEIAHSDHPKWLLAYLVDWHRREVNAEWWDYFRLRDLPEEELLDERDAVAGLQFVEQVEVVLSIKGRPTGSVVHRYSYPQQDIELKKRLRRVDGEDLGEGDDFGEIVNHDRQCRLLDVKRGPKTASLPHPTCAFSADVIGIDGLQKSVISFAERVLGGSDDCGVQLLFGHPPRLRANAFAKAADESERNFAVRIAPELDRTTLAIQGPPGSGKTFIGAQMILALVKMGKKVGVTAISHKVIRNLLDEVVKQAAKAEQVVKVGVKPGETQEAEVIAEFHENEDALAGIAGGAVDVLGGTSFMWAREDFAGAVDVLFVDEAGQMSLANVLAVSPATNSLVLLGDPQQLDQPEKANHPDGVGVSALQHVLGDHETMPPEKGIFLPTTWRMSPTLCAFTSELFYEGKLRSKAGLEAQQLVHTGPLDGSHLWLVPVDHDGNQSSSMEEVETVEALVKSLLVNGTEWVNEKGATLSLTAADLRIVAPFNAQVNRLIERLSPFSVPVGTVDKFQGQTCAVAIYSMATSRPEDAPRGMEFLYSLNRLNVATSRARCAVFVVASPKLFEPECRTPRQMQLANALCRYREMAQMLK